MTSIPLPLVSPGELSDAIREEPRLVVVDATWSLDGTAGVDDYLRAHLPDARFIAVTRELSRPPGPGGRHPLPTIEQFERAMSRLGIGADSLVVAYDQGDGLGSARVWWLLRYFGHNDVGVLRGGLAAWRREGFEVQQGPVREPDPNVFTAHPNEEMILELSEVTRWAATDILVDVRAQDRYLGLSEPIDPVAGHIPGAVNLPISKVMTQTGGVGDSATIVEALKTAGMLPEGDHRLAAYCGSGITAALFALAVESSGLGLPKIYPGSWSQWIYDPDRPTIEHQE